MINTDTEDLNIDSREELHSENLPTLLNILNENNKKNPSEQEISSENKNEIENRKVSSDQMIEQNREKLETKMQNFNPSEHIQNYNRFPNRNMFHPHHHTSSQYIKIFIKRISFYIDSMASQLFSSLDMAVTNTNFPNILKNILHTKQVLIFLYMFNVQGSLSVLEKENKSVKDYIFVKLNYLSLFLMLFWIIILKLHNYLLGYKLFLEKDQELEKFMLERNPKLNEGRCPHCQLLSAMRSFHCLYCKKCVLKFELHSDWFNMCIGSNNELIYAITLFFTLMYFLASIIIYWYIIFLRPVLINFFVIIYFLINIIACYVLFKAGTFLYNFITVNLLKNITFYENKNFGRLTYLSNNISLRGFFNPFDKGWLLNFKELIVNLFDIDIYIEYKIKSKNNNDNLINKPTQNNLKEEEIDDEEKMVPGQIYNLDEFYRKKELKAFKNMLKISGPCEPFISQKGNIYKKVYGGEIINWNRLRLFTVFDIIDSPFTVNMINHAKTVLEEVEENKEIENVEKVDNTEKIDNVEEKVDNVEKVDKEEKVNNEEKADNEEKVDKEEKNDNEEKTDNVKNEENKEHVENIENLDKEDNKENTSD